MCGDEVCNQMLQKDPAANGKRLLHTKEECDLLSNSRLGNQIEDFEKENIVFACIFIHRM